MRCINTKDNISLLACEYGDINFILEISNYLLHNVCEETELIFILYNSDEGQNYYANRLGIYNYAGKLLVEFDPPQNYVFYRFEDHMKSRAGLSVVCIGEPDKYGRDAWHFGIDVVVAELYKIGLSY